MKRILSAAVLLIASVAVSGQQDFSRVQIKATKVAGNIYMLEGSGGNIGVSVGPDGLLIVDDQFAPLADKIREALKGLADGRLRFVLNTHWHGDHTGGNVVFGVEAPIIAHDNVRKRLESGMDVGTRKVPAAPKEALPVITFDNRVSVFFNGEEIRAIHFPKGHTDGDSIIFFTRSNVVHMGDDFFVGRFPFVDIDSGGDVEGLIKNIADVIPKIPADAKIIPGHGAISSIDDLKKYHTMLVTTVGIVRKKMADKKTLDQIKADGLGEEWKSWGTGFINEARWIETIYRGLSNK